MLTIACEIIVLLSLTELLKKALVNDRLTDSKVFSIHIRSKLELYLLEKICCIQRLFELIAEKVIWLEDPCSIIQLSGEENSELSLLMRYFAFIYCWTKYLESLVNFVLMID